ncbi:hypothetical protein M405DRAFT_807307 [Rhizopogon salebrosus TDB-379]|nr:hypothetical protein M405DRAFT_807307 [Rhizopogon salebrosus TDB-379]
MPDQPDWSKLKGAIFSRASDALNDVKQLKDSIPQQNVQLPEVDWSKLSGAIVSRASDALNEVKQLKDSVSQQNPVDMPHIDLSKLSGGVLSRATHALNEVKRLKNSMSQQDHVNLRHVEWSKLSGGILSRASDALNVVKQLNLVSVSHDWSFAITTVFQQQGGKLWRLIKTDVSDVSPGRPKSSSSASKPQGIIFSCAYYALTGVNGWSIRHPYVATGALLCISANPELLLTPLRLTFYICLPPSLLIIWPFKVLSRFMLYILASRRDGIMNDSFASQHQSSRYGGYVPRDSAYAKLQSDGASVPKDGPKFSDTISLLSGTGAVYVLGRTWGWANLLGGAGALALLCGMLNEDKIS